MNAIIYRLNYPTYSQAISDIEASFDRDFPDLSEYTLKIDRIVASTVASLEGDVEVFSLAAHSHSLLLGALKLARGGHYASVYPLLRTAFESSAYALLLKKEPRLITIWKNRHVSKETFDESKKSFTPAMKKLRLILSEYDRDSNESPYEEFIMSMYDAVIDFGAHPNPITITNSITSSDSESSYTCLEGCGTQMLKSVFACIEYGTIFSILHYLAYRLNNPEAESLDVKFTPLIKENNNLADKVSDAPIESKYYSKINNHAKFD